MSSVDGHNMAPEQCFGLSTFVQESAVDNS